MKKREVTYDVMRIIAIIAVIGIHVSAANWYQDTINSYWLINNFINALVHPWAVPLFLCITGALLLKKDIDCKMIFRKYIPRILLCLIVWHFIYYFSFGNTISIENIFIAFKKMLIGKSFSHLWYLYLLIGIYILIPILCKLVKALDRKQLIYLLSILFVVTILVPSIKMFVKIDLSVYITPFKVFTLNEYIFFLLLGYYLNNYEIKNKIFTKVLPIISLILIIGNAWYGNHLSIINQVTITFAKTNTIISVLAVITIFIVIKRAFAKKESKIITKIGELTFGVYLIHFWILEFLAKYHLTANIINPIFGNILFIIFTFVLSCFISYIISKVPYLRKIIGLK